MSRVLSFKGRAIPLGKRVAVYRNRRSGQGEGLWSIKDTTSGLVCAHADFVRLEKVEAVVSAVGRARAVKTGQRNVHAFLVGTLNGASYVYDFAADRQGGRKITYNPFRDKGFLVKGKLAPNAMGEVVFCDNGHAYLL
jgi:hypothetical protein